MFLYNFDFFTHTHTHTHTYKKEEKEKTIYKLMNNLEETNRKYQIPRRK